MRCIYVVFFLAFSLCCTAQNSYKYEKEERIEKKKFPQKALDLLDNTLPKKVRRVKYYREQDSAKISFETKLKYNGDIYSIEFDKNGKLEDVEVTIKKKHVEPNTFEKITKYMKSNYDAFRIKKIQRQYKNTVNDIAEKVIDHAFSNEMDTSYAYEIIAEVKTGKKRYFIEITFTKNGDFQLVRTIIRNSYDHILY